MKNLKLASRIFALAGVLSFLLILIGVVGLLGISMANNSLDSMYRNKMLALETLGEYQVLETRTVLTVSSTLLMSSPEQVERNITEAIENLKTGDKLWSALTNLSMSGEMKRLVATTESSHKKLVNEGIFPTIASLQNSDFPAAKSIVIKKFDALFQPLSNDINSLVGQLKRESSIEYGEAVARYNVIRNVFGIAIVFGLAFALIFGLVLMREVSKSLAIMGNVANAVAQGDMSQDIVTTGRTEMSVVMRALAAMQSNLSQVVHKVRENAVSLDRVSAKIESGNQELSTRTERQASALEETAASMEELVSNVKKNAASAKQANQLAINASAIATKGGDVVNTVVSTMRNINDSSQKISEIIGVINGIAFQTNILALNAAVEAARAGEQGRGFAVVAAEVRNLAQRTATAAKEIKHLIDTSVERVCYGTGLVDQAGRTMTEIVDSIHHVADIVGEISDASIEQSLGVAQIGNAITQVDQATQQNAELVGEMAEEARNLKAQSEDLVTVVAMFKLNHSKTSYETLALLAPMME